MSGTIPLSLTQQFDEFGDPLGGGRLYLYQAGTVATPQNGYQDAALTLVMPNPIELDAAGRVPQFFLADGYIKIRLDDKHGITQLARDGVLVIGPSAGGGGGGSGVDPTTILQPGMISMFYGTGSVSGFVRCNGRTIGSATSGASERANADCSALFQFLWNADSNLAVIPSRGASAASDWAANRQITLPDCRGRTLAGLDDMGASSPAGRLTVNFWGGSGLALGQTGGDEKNLLALNNMPSHAHDGFIKITDPTHLHGSGFSGTPINLQGGGTFTNAYINFSPVNTASASTGISANLGSSAGASDNKVAAVGGGAAHANMQPTMLVTIYLKL